VQSVPDLAKADSELSKEVVALLKSEPLFEQIPQGFQRAAEVAHLRLMAKETPALKEKITKLEAEVKRLQKATSINGSSPTSPSSAKNFNDLSIDEMGDQLRRVAEQEDRMGNV